MDHLATFAPKSEVAPEGMPVIAQTKSLETSHGMVELSLDELDAVGGAYAIGIM